MVFFFSTLLSAESLILSGTVISDNEKMITSRFMGFVTQVNVFEGEQVKKRAIALQYRFTRDRFCRTPGRTLFADVSEPVY
jgi:multidrug efflux pump subunit AcrA (membrane-fusion protein)